MPKEEPDGSAASSPNDQKSKADGGSTKSEPATPKSEDKTGDNGSTTDDSLALTKGPRNKKGITIYLLAKYMIS